MCPAASNQEEKDEKCRKETVIKSHPIQIPMV
jgi:hypothetical protein